MRREACATSSSQTVKVQVLRLFPCCATLLVMWQAELSPRSAYAQTLAVSPPCVAASGTEGTTFSVRGSGWTPQGPEYCIGGTQRYTYYFDGVEIAHEDFPIGVNQNQPFKTGLQPPPGTSPGTHVARVKLTAPLNGGGTFCQCCEIDLCVVAAPPSGNPWTNSVGTGTPGYPYPVLTLGFDPSLTCNVQPCKQIRFIQIIRREGQLPNDDWVLLNAEEMSGPGSSVNPALVADNGWAVDLPERDSPFYRGQWSIGGARKCAGKEGDTNMKDGPLHSDGSYIARSLLSIRKTYKAFAFCASGEGAGQYLGEFNWTWKRDFGDPRYFVYNPNIPGRWHEIPVGVYSGYGTAPPSQTLGPELDGALRKWSEVTSLSAPNSATPRPEEGGRVCSCP